MNLRVKDGLILGAIAIPLTILLVAIFANLKGFESGMSEVVAEVWMGVKMLFFTALGLGVIYGLVKIHQATKVRVIGPSKHGPAQALIVQERKGFFQVEQRVEQLNVGQMQMDPMEQIALLEKIMKIASTTATTDQRMLAMMQKYGTVDVQPSPTEDRKMLPSSNLEQSINLSQDYLVPADDFLSGRKLIVGVSGSGKSNSIGTYGEELGRLEVPFVLADTEDEYRPLCDPRWLRNGILAGATGMYSVSVDNAEQFGHYVLDNLLQVILNLQSYEMVEAAQVMIGIIKGMREWQEELPNEKRIPSDFIFEEAVTWLPQYVNESPLKSQDPQTLAALQNTFFNDMVRKGRKRGLGITLVCQKIAELDNRAMQSDGRLLHRQTEEADLERYRKMGITREESLSLQNGEAFLFTGRVSKKRIQVRRRHSPHGANTPGLEQLRHHQIARNATKGEPEIWGIFDENTEKQTGGLNSFGQPIEPIDNISKFHRTEISVQKSPEREVPEMLRTEILQRYADGMKRTAIRDDLQINGDQYWMVREVCDEYDRQRQAVQ
jgi:hypothetical protein